MYQKPQQIQENSWEQFAKDTRLQLSQECLRSGYIKTIKVALTHTSVKNLYPILKSLIEKYLIAPQEVGLKQDNWTCEQTVKERG